MRHGSRVGGRGRRVAGGMVAGFAFTALALGPATVAYAVDCTPAGTLTADGYPQRAIAYVDGVNAGYGQDANKECRDERAAAVEKVELAEVSALEAERLAAEASRLDGDEAAAKKQDAEAAAREALDRDRENARAAAFLSAETSTPDSWWQTLAKGWDRFTKTTLTPLGTVALPAALLVAGLLTAARILAAGATWTGRSGADQATRRLRWSWIAIATASAGLVGLMAGIWPTVTGPARWLIASTLVALAGVGVWNAAWGMARRLRIVVAVRNAGADDGAKSAHVLALLEQFGASPPKGIERPAGPDVTALENVLSEAGTGWLATLKSGLATLFGWTPWRVTVDYGKDPEVTVTITRNGHARGSVVIAPSLHTIGGAKIDPAVYAAAFVIVTLARDHTGFEGLCGASDWRGLAIQYTAAELPLTEAEQPLVRALIADPGNWLAKVDHASSRWRASKDADQLRAYDDWLTNAIATIENDHPHDPHRLAFTPLLLRIKIIRAAARINIVFARRDGPAPDDAVSRARDAIADLCNEVARADGRLTSPGHATWLDTIKTRTAGMAESVRAVGLESSLSANGGPATLAMIDAWATLPRGPQSHYSWACSLATPGLTVPDQLPDDALDAFRTELRNACALPHFAQWMHEDPQLAWFTRTPYYDEFRPSPRSDLFALKPYTTKRPALERLGLTSPDLLAETDPAMLAAQLGWAEPAAARLIDAASTYRATASLSEIGNPDLVRLSDKGRERLGRLGVEIVDALISQDLASPRRLGDLDDAKVEACAIRLAKATSHLVGAEPDVLTTVFANWIVSLRRS